MRVVTFFEKFELFTDSPDAVAKMRELVLQLAMRGKLVEQDPQDGDASSLLEAIALARKVNGRRKVTDPATTLEQSEVEKWHDIPPSWRWVQLGTIGDIVGGGTPRSESPDYFAGEGIPWLTPADLNGFRGKRIFRGRRFITPLGFDNSSAQLLPEGSVLFSSRAPIGYVAIAGTELATNQGFKSCIPHVKETNEFLYYYLRSAAARIDSEAPGTTFREVSGRIVNKIPVPLAPLAEQKRIVARVDELMALCDRLETQLQEREARHSVLAHASIIRFADEPNLDLLLHKSYNISPVDFRRLILDLAVQGKLATSAPDDDKVRSVEEFRGATAAVATSLGLRTPNDSVEQSEPPFDIPSHWNWMSLADIGVAQTGTTPSKDDHDAFNGEVPFIKPADILPNSIDYSNESLTRTGAESGSRLAPAGSLLMVCIGTIGKCNLIERECAFNQQINSLSPVSWIHPRFLLIAARAPYFFERAWKKSSRTTIAILNKSKWVSIPIPVPPIGEQRRIVAKVDELMTLVDALDTLLATARTSGANLVEAAVAELTAEA